MSENSLQNACFANARRHTLAVMLTAMVLSWSYRPAGAQTADDPSTPALAAKTPIRIKVWPGLAPGEATSSPGVLGDLSGNVARLKDVTAPELFIYPVTRSSPRPAVLVLPGGGYQILATDLEGSEIARWLNQLGYVAAVLHYRVPDKRDGALQDGQRAISLLRSRAGEFGIDPQRLGVLGFSAGGHLSARLAVNGDKRTYEPVDEKDETHCRPDFAMLIYPAYLSGKEPDSAAADVKPVAGMPPMFLAQTLDDPHLSTPQYAKALASAGIPVENHVYDKGGHGYGLRLAPDVPAARWSTDAADWLQKYFPTRATGQ